jgi:hypothetical protein
VIFLEIAAIVILYRAYKREVGQRNFRAVAELKAIFGGKPIPPYWADRIAGLEAEIAALKLADESKAQKIAELEVALKAYGFL